MTKSTFYHDGYRDALKGKLPSLPGIPVFDEEYLDGYCGAIEVMDSVIALSKENSNGLKKAEHKANSDTKST